VCVCVCVLVTVANFCHEFMLRPQSARERQVGLNRAVFEALFLIPICRDLGGTRSWFGVSNPSLGRESCYKMLLHQILDIHGYLGLVGPTS
jgi:hypothetical protein